MKELEKNIRYAELFSLYGDFIKSKQKEILEDYFDFDMTISEIAEEKNITKQAVFDFIKKKIAVLEEYESKLHLLEVRQALKNCLTDLEDKKYEKVASEIKNILEEI